MIGFSTFLLIILIFCFVNSHAQTDTPAPRNIKVAACSPERDLGDFDFYPGDFSNFGIIGNSLPGTWRPFSADSPWNTPIPTDTESHPESRIIISYAASQASHLRLANSYLIPVWVVNSNNLPSVIVRSYHIFDFWDTDFDGWSDVGVPLTSDMWPEPTSDGHICIIDPFKKVAYEMSRFERLANGTTKCTTFNIWDITGSGIGDCNQGKRWKARGGRGSGFPEIAGLVRPEEIAKGEIRHALVFTFSKNRKADNGAKIFIPPACRSDGKYIGSKYPIEGMRFQLDPTLTDLDFEEWGLSETEKIVARALQKYGMFLGDNGGSMALQLQLLAPTPEKNRQKWEDLFPGFYDNIKNIPTDKFRIVYTGEPIIKN